MTRRGRAVRRCTTRLMTHWRTECTSCLLTSGDAARIPFYAPFLSDWRNYEAWEAAGAVWTPARAHQVFQDIIAGFEAPPMDEGIREELADFVARRKAEGGAPTDF